MIAVGSRLGSYELLGRLGSGGMASVYVARRHGVEGFQRLATVKVVHPHLTEDDRFVQMFLDEARICTRLDHPNLVRVEELGQHEGTYYLAMEYVRGCSLAQLIEALHAEERKLRMETATWIAIQVADALHAAHEATNETGEPLNLVHRDVSPQNVLISYTGHVKLIDFGVAKARGRACETGSISLKGKFGYMAPEQATARPVDRRTDVYGLGLIAWELLAGRKRFEAPNDLALLDVVRDPTPEPVSQWARVPPSLDEAIARATAPDPAARPASARDLRKLLVDACPSAAAVEPAEVAELLACAMLGPVSESIARLQPELASVLERELLARPEWRRMRETSDDERHVALASLTLLEGDNDWGEATEPSAPDHIEEDRFESGEVTDQLDPTEETTKRRSVEPGAPSARAPARHGAAQPPIDRRVVIGAGALAFAILAVAAGTLLAALTGDGNATAATALPPKVDSDTKVVLDYHGQ